jgi:hypothetical protein
MECSGLTNRWNGPWAIAAAPCAPWDCVRGPVRNGGRGRPFNGIVNPQMRKLFIIVVVCLLSVANAFAVDGWEVTRPEFASRRVVATLYWGKVVVDRWAWPVGKDVEVVDREQDRTITLPKRLKHYPKRIYAQTWIAGTNAGDTVLRYAWYGGEAKDSPRILNNLIIVPFSTKQSYDLGDGLRMEAVYEAAG